MRMDKHDIPTAIDVPGAKARQAPDFGATDGCGTLAAEYFSLGAGTDIAPLLRGLEDDACQAPHWGYVIGGELVVSYTGGRPDDACSGGDVFYWPAGHSVRVVADAEIILFSPQAQHAAVMAHMRTAMAG
ncbi:MAG: cupin domain-containing protein [Ilumatobacteraceae bacterium]